MQYTPRGSARQGLPTGLEHFSSSTPAPSSVGRTGSAQREYAGAASLSQNIAREREHVQRSLAQFAALPVEQRLEEERELAAARRRAAEEARAASLDRPYDKPWLENSVLDTKQQQQHGAGTALSLFGSGSGANTSAASTAHKERMYRWVEGVLIFF